MCETSTYSFGMAASMMIRLALAFLPFWPPLLYRNDWSISLRTASVSSLTSNVQDSPLAMTATALSEAKCTSGAGNGPCW